MRSLIFEKFQNYKIAKITNSFFCFGFRHRFCILFYIYKLKIVWSGPVQADIYWEILQ